MKRTSKMFNGLLCLFLGCIVLAVSSQALAQGTWETLTPLPEPFIRHALVASGGHLYNIGGINSGGVLSGDKVYYAKIEGPDALGPWTPGASLPKPTFFHAAAAHDGVLYVLGGCDVDFIDFAVLGLAWYSQPGDGNWNEICDISEPNDNVIDELDLEVFAENWLAGL